MHGGDKPRRGFNEVWRSDQHWSRTNTTLKQPETSCSTKSFQYTSRSYSSILLLDFNHSWLKIIPLNEVYIRCIHSAPMCPLRGYLDYLPLIKLQFCIILIQTQLLGQILFIRVYNKKIQNGLLSLLNSLLQTIFCHLRKSMCIKTIVNR